jgi:hypothetical protein
LIAIIILETKLSQIDAARWKLQCDKLSAMRDQFLEAVQLKSQLETKLKTQSIRMAKQKQLHETAIKVSFYVF